MMPVKSSGGYPLRSIIVIEAEKCGFYPEGFKETNHRAQFDSPVCLNSRILEYMIHQGFDAKEGENILLSDREILLYPQMASGCSEAKKIYGWTHGDFSMDEDKDLVLPRHPVEDYRVAGIIILSDPLRDRIEGLNMKSYVIKVAEKHGVEANSDGSRVYCPVDFGVPDFGLDLKTYITKVLLAEREIKGVVEARRDEAVDSNLFLSEAFCGTD